MIFNIVNNKCYVGSTKNFRKRKFEHFRVLRNNKHHSKHLQRAWNKYKEENFSFSILERVEDLSTLIDREMYWIELKGSLKAEKGYNMSIPKEGSNLELRPEIIKKLLLTTYNQYYKDNPIISLEEFLNGKRAKDLIEKLGPQNKKKVYAFNKKTGIKEYEFESITDTAKKLGVKINSVERALSKDNMTCKGLILVKEEDYDSEKVYIKIYKTKPYKSKGRFKGNPVETFDLLTNETIMKFNNKYEMAEYYNTSLKYVNKVFNKEKNHLKTFGVRYS